MWEKTKNYCWAKMPLASAFRPTCNICSALSPLFAESAFFHTKIKNLSWNRWIYEPMGAKHQKLLLGNNAPGKCLQAHMQHFFSPSRAIEKRFAESAFFSTKIKNLSWNHWIYEPMGAKHQKLLLGNNAPGKCLHAHIQHFFSPSPANEEKFAESAFFHTKIKHLSWSRWIYELIEAKHKTLLLGNNSPGKCVQAHMQHFFSLSPAMKFAQSAFLYTKIKNFWNRWIYEPMGENTKNYSWATIPLASAFRPTCNICSALSPLFAESAFFHTKIKNLSWNRWIYEPMGAKHQKLLLGNNAPGKCLHAHMQHFFSPSPAIEEKFAESAFLHTKNQKPVMKPLNLRANGGKTPKTTPGQQFPWQVPSGPHATFLQP